MLFGPGNAKAYGIWQETLTWGCRALWGGALVNCDRLHKKSRDFICFKQHDKDAGEMGIWTGIKLGKGLEWLSSWPFQPVGWWIVCGFPSAVESQTDTAKLPAIKCFRSYSCLSSLFSILSLLPFFTLFFLPLFLSSFVPLFLYFLYIFSYLYFSSFLFSLLLSFLSSLRPSFFYGHWRASKIKSANFVKRS